MSFIFQIKRRAAGTVDSAPTGDVYPGELLFDEGTNTLYYATTPSVSSLSGV